MPDETKKPTREEAEQSLVRSILEQAWQQVKPIVKQEREGEKINQELLDFRLKATVPWPGRRQWEHFGSR